MAQSEKCETNNTRKGPLFYSTVTSNGSNSFFPWSPRTSPSLIFKPSTITTKPSYSIQPALKAKSDLTTKVQEISIDQTWFKQTDVASQEDGRNVKNIIENPNETVAATSVSAQPASEEVIYKQTVKGISSEADVKRNATGKEHNHFETADVTVTAGNGHMLNPVLISEDDVVSERLDKIESLILSDKYVLSELGQSNNRLEHEGKQTYFQDSNNHTPMCQRQSLITRTVSDDNERQPVYTRSDSCSASVCSSCSVASTYPSRSRCSSGDGCSSVECEGRHHSSCSVHNHYHHGSTEQPLLKTPPLGRKYTVCDSGETESTRVPQSVSHNCDYNDGHFSKCILHEDRRHYRRPLVDMRDDIVLEEAHSCGQPSVRRKNSITQMQLMFYIFKLQVSKYGELKSVIEAQQLSLKCQNQSINRLAQCIMLLSLKLHQQTSSLDCLSTTLRRQETERLSSKYRQTVIITSIVGVVIIYLLHLETVQGKISSFFRTFGFTRHLNSLNRKRRMISEIWRDIPPLLTNFWRIFIFRGGG